MLDFDVKRCTRRCAKTERELRPGEWFYSVLLAEGGDVVRCDYCEQAWEGAPETAIAWWKSQMPSPDAKKLHWAPNDVMLHYFVQLQEDPQRRDVRYVLALLMIRRRILRIEASEHDESGREQLVCFCPRNETEYRIAVSTPGPERVAAIQQELGQLLFGSEA